MYRKTMSNKQSRRKFTSGAMRTHPINTAPIPNRGGLRL